MILDRCTRDSVVSDPRSFPDMYNLQQRARLDADRLEQLGKLAVQADAEAGDGRDAERTGGSLTGPPACRR